MTRLYLFFLLRLLLGVVFLTSGCLKLNDLQTFFKVIESFGFDLGTYTRIIGILLTTSEIFCGVLMIIGLWVKAASLALVVLLIFFVAVIISQLAVGNEIACGCFGAFSQSKVDYTLLSRDIALLFFTLAVFSQDENKFSIDTFLKQTGRLYERKDQLETDN